MQVKSLWVYAALPKLKLDTSSQVSRAHNKDKICKSGWLKWQRKKGGSRDMAP